MNLNKLKNTIQYRWGYYMTKVPPFKGINLGGGGDKIADFINIDADWKTDCDIVSDLRNPLRFADNSIQYIYNSHTMEHLPRKLLGNILIDWNRVLMPGGKLFICVPDIEVLFKTYLEGLKDYKANEYSVRLAADIVYGGQKDQFDFHYNGHSFTTLKALLEEVGYKNVQRFEHKNVDFLSHLRDAGNTANINGVSVSLNVVAEK